LIKLANQSRSNQAQKEAVQAIVIIMLQ